MQLYIIDYESYQWCGGGSHVVVHASSPEEAALKASLHMDETMRELFSDEYDDPDMEGQDDEQAYTINAIEVLDEESPYWQFWQDPEQRAAFYPEIF